MKRDLDRVKSDSAAEVEKLEKIVKTLEEELTHKAEKIKQHEIRLKEAAEEGRGTQERIRKLQGLYEKMVQQQTRGEQGPPEINPDQYSDGV